MMPAGVRQRKLLIPALMVALALPVLLALGFWQLERKAWKEGLIADIASRAQAPAVAFESVLGPDGMPAKDPAGMEYTAVRARGRFEHDKEMHLYAPDPREGPGVDVITPLVLESSGAIVLVDRGYVPDRVRDPSLRAEGQPAGTVELTALVRAPGRRGAFAPPYDPRTRLWFWRDLDGMAAEAGAGASPKILPLFLDAKEAAPGGWPRGGATRLDLPNRHLEYALTWFGLAAALVAVFALYVLTRPARSHP